MLLKLFWAAAAVAGVGGVAISPVAPAHVRVVAKEAVGWDLTPSEALWSAKDKATMISRELRSALADLPSREADQAALEQRIPGFKKAAEAAKAKTVFARGLLAVAREQYEVAGTFKSPGEVARDALRFEQDAATADRHCKAVSAAAEANARAVSDLRRAIAERERVLLELGQEIQVAEILMKANMAHTALVELGKQVGRLACIGSRESFVEQLRLSPLPADGHEDDYARALTLSGSTN